MEKRREAQLWGLWVEAAPELSTELPRRGSSSANTALLPTPVLPHPPSALLKTMAIPFSEALMCLPPCSPWDEGWGQSQPDGSRKGLKALRESEKIGQALRDLDGASRHSFE